MDSLAQKLTTAVWIASSLYNRNKTSGSSANLSFLHEDTIYITGSGTCFGCLTANDFVPAGGPGKTSKELPLHQTLYRICPGVEAVVHVHSTYATLWSCLLHNDHTDIIPPYTPYLGMKLGKVGLVPYAPPGSTTLFDQLAQSATPERRGYLLANHGPVVGGSSLMEAYFALEELEESAKIAWKLRNEPDRAQLLIQ